MKLLIKATMEFRLVSTAFITDCSYFKTLLRLCQPAVFTQHFSLLYPR